MATPKPIPTEANANLVREEVLRDLVTNTNEDKIRKTMAHFYSCEAGRSDILGTIRAFTQCVYSGTTPSAQILSIVAERFNLYLEGNGNRTLDQACNLAPKQRIGHPIIARNKNARLNQLCTEMWGLRELASRNGERLSIERAAAKVIERFDLKESEDTLKKFYIDNKIQDILDAAERIIQKKA